MAHSIPRPPTRNPENGHGGPHPASALGGRALPGAKITLLQLIAATYFMVAGGPYGLEDLVNQAGYLVAVLVLVLLPFVWSLPTAFMVSELSSALPEEGGYYVWVRRALGPFWGFQEAWLSIAASIFDMAIYPALVVRYLGFVGKMLGGHGVWQQLADEGSSAGWFLKLAVVVVCVLLNLRGARTVGGSAVLLAVVLLGPFVVLTFLALLQPGTATAATTEPAELDYFAGIMVAMWNYMGWDNATTVAGEVDRPQRTYPLAMLATVLLVVLTYAVPVLAASRTGISASSWEEGSWVEVGSVVGGRLLALALGVGGMVAALGTFNSLVLSYSRVPAVLAEDGYLPALFARRQQRTGVPWVSVLACAASWTLALQLSLPRLFALDIILYGLSLLLEFAALFYLRLREPALERPFRVPGGLVNAGLLGLGPALLIATAVWHEWNKSIVKPGDPFNPQAAILLGAGLVVLGPVIYLASRLWRRRGSGALVACLVLLTLAGTLQATPPADEPVLRWGGDKEGGAPYIYEDRNGKLTGFEVQLADYLARKIGRRAEFVQKDWSNLPQDLKRGDVDCILNGYEWSPEREQEMASTIPYYLYKLQLLARQGDTSIQSWDDLHRRPRKQVGVLTDSAAQRYVEKEFGRDVNVVAKSEEGTTGVMLSVVSGQLDATVQDVPVARFYVGQGHEFPELRPVGEPVAPGYYVIFVRPEDTVLRRQLNDALREALQDGTLERLYNSYGLWNADQEHLLDVAEDWPPNQQAADHGPLWFGLTLIRAAGMTVVLSCLSMPLAILVGLLVAVARLYGPAWLNALLGVYVEVLRGTPLLLQLYVIYYVLPDLIGLKLSPFGAGVLGLAINYSAYEAENYRAGLLAVPRGQMEAALALGMSQWTALRRVIVPQAVRIVIPPVTNDFIALFKDTSVCSVIAVTELTARYRHLLVENPREMIQLGLITALLYLLMSYPLSLLARRLEVRFHRPAA